MEGRKEEIPSSNKFKIFLIEKLYSDETNGFHPPMSRMWNNRIRATRVSEAHLFKKKSVFLDTTAHVRTCTTHTRQ